MKAADPPVNKRAPASFGPHLDFYHIFLVLRFSGARHFRTSACLRLISQLLRSRRNTKCNTVSDWVPGLRPPLCKYAAASLGLRRIEASENKFSACHGSGYDLRESILKDRPATNLTRSVDLMRKQTRLICAALRLAERGTIKFDEPVRSSAVVLVSQL